MPTAYKDVALLLRRVGFGPHPSEINALTPLDLAAVVDKVLDTSSAPEVVAPPTVVDDITDSWSRWTPALTWWFDRVATTPAPIAEKMVLFWHGHFTSSADDPNLREVWYQKELFRSAGMGSLRLLCHSVAKDPAMPKYLDNYKNVVAAPNENFARELMELFVLGVDQYTQNDVVAASRAWTGHSLSADRRTYLFNSTKHDYNNKTFFGITKNWDGPDIIEELYRGSKSPVAATFMARKLWAFFAYANPEQAVVDAISRSLLTTDWDVKVALRTLFLRQVAGRRQQSTIGCHLHTPGLIRICPRRRTDRSTTTIRASSTRAGTGTDTRTRSPSHHLVERRRLWPWPPRLQERATGF